MLQKYNRWKVARVFFNEPRKEHYLREISRKSGLSTTSVKKHLESLKDEKIIEGAEVKRGERTYPLYKAQTFSDKYKKLKKTDFLYRMENTGLLEYLEETFSPDCIVLFGSASRGEDTEDSDIDLFLQAEERNVELDEYEEGLNRKIQLHLNPDFKDYPEELKNNIANGIVLRGFLEVF